MDKLKISEMKLCEDLKKSAKAYYEGVFSQILKESNDSDMPRFELVSKEQARKSKSDFDGMYYDTIADFGELRMIWKDKNS